MNTEPKPATGEQECRRIIERLEHRIEGLQSLLNESQRQLAAEPKPTGEWTVQDVGEMGCEDYHGAKAIADTHNAQIAAAYEKGHEDGYSKAYDKYATF